MAYISFQPSDYFSTKLYTGTGSSLAITGVGFQPDFNWIKTRNDTQWHVLTDAVRGNTKNIYSNSGDAEETNTNRIQSWDSDGFTLGTDGTTNGSGDTLVSWNWKAGTTTGITGSPSITPSSYSFNQTSGFSIIAYTGTGSSATVPHGLGVVPDMIIVKALSATTDWGVYHQYSNAVPEDYSLLLNVTNAAGDNNLAWDDTAPTSTVFSVAAGDTNATSVTHIAYCFAEIKGYSKFGKYQGNGNADGAFVYTGFRPAWIMIKRTDSSNNWMMFDDKRDGYNNQNDFVLANSTAAESSSDDFFAILSNGFKLTATNAALNASGGTYVYAAFAEFPLVSSNDVPGVAR